MNDETTTAKTVRWMMMPASGPKWKRSACIDENGSVYAPAHIAGPEEKVFYAASWDGNVACVERDGHFYLPVDWMATEYPAQADICELIKRRVIEHFAAA